jgi:hypothetical protein
LPLQDLPMLLLWFLFCICQRFLPGKYKCVNKFKK